ncbi:hypothetical protein K439DRAFT_1618497 [Ramaria rubella]|nr:hypothetical protein K439DRAFT_1618497 [Ramaria rubella]
MFEIGHALDAVIQEKRQKIELNGGGAKETTLQCIYMIVVLALYKKTSRGGGDIFKSKIEDLRTLALLLKSPQSQIWSGIDSNDLTATNTFIEKMYNTCILRLETDHDLDIWTPTIDTQNHSMELTMHKDAVKKPGHLMIPPLIKPANDERKSYYGVTIVEVPCLPPAGRYCGEETQVLTETQRTLANKAEMVVNMDEF